MSADNYALIGIHPLAGTGVFPTTLHGVYIGFMSNDNHPTEIPEMARSFATHEKATAYANELETEYGVTFLCDCTTEDEQAPTAKKTKLASKIPGRVLRDVAGVGLTYVDEDGNELRLF